VTEPQRILIVDDDAFIRRPLEFILREEGYQPVTAADAEEGLRAIEACPPDLIFLDVMMPGKDGLTWCGELKRDARYARIPIILLSARGQERDRQQALALGAADLLTKPYSPHELKRRVRELIGRG
jgi:two-component system phosphate regulon response regulator PhoB